MRLFLALWPDEAALQRIVEIQNLLREQITRQGVRFARPERIHLTLHFYGDVSEARLPELEAALATVDSPPLTLRTTEIGAFPDMRRPKVVHLGLEGDGLAELQAKAAKAVDGLVPSEDRFTPHLTLARVNPGSKEVGRILWGMDPQAAKPPAQWTVHRLSLMQTLPDSSYEEVRGWPLA